MKALSRLAGLTCPRCGAPQAYWPAALTMRKWSRVAPWREVRCPNCGCACRVSGDAYAQTMVRLGTAVGAGAMFLLFGIGGLVLMLPVALIVPFRSLGMEAVDEEGGLSDVRSASRAA